MHGIAQNEYSGEATNPDGAGPTWEAEETKESQMNISNPDWYFLSGWWSIQNCTTQLVVILRCSLLSGRPLSFHTTNVKINLVFFTAADSCSSNRPISIVNGTYSVRALFPVIPDDINYDWYVHDTSKFAINEWQIVQYKVLFSPPIVPSSEFDHKYRYLKSMYYGPFWLLRF